MHPLIPIHVAAGAVLLLSGAAAVSLPKGSRYHARTGSCFFASTLVMGGTGTVIASSLPERGTATIGILCCYLVATSWASARRRDGVAGRFEWVGLAVALACLVSFLAIGLIGLGEADGKLDLLPAPVHFPFAALAAVAAALDLSFIVRRQLTGVQRIARHLWRMSAALLIAAFSFFLGQQDNMPAFMRGSPLLYLPPLAVLAAMIFWILRVRYSKAFHWVRPRRPAVPADAGSGRLAREHA
jgi:hypothetical protein